MAEQSLAITTSFAQQSLWLQHQIDPGRSAYHVVAGVRLRGALDVPALTAALNAVAARHETLRTVFRLDAGVPVQVIGPVPPLTVPVVDVTAQEVDALVQREIETPFDLAAGPLVRLRLLRLAADHHVAVLVMHHIITDGESTAILLRELLLHYAAEASGEPLELPELPIQYADFAVWQRDLLGGARLDRLTDYWSGRLAGAAPLALPRPEDGAERGPSAGGLHEFTVPASLRARLEAAARDGDATLFMILLAGFDALLGRWCGQEDVTVLSPVSGRSRPELEEIIGYFVNPLLLRADLSGDPDARTVLARVRETCLGAYDHEELPYEQAANLIRGPGTERERTADGRVMMVLQSPREENWSPAGLEWEQIPVGIGTAKAPLVLDLRPGSEVLHGVLEYDSGLFDAATVAALGEDLLAAWEWLADLSSLPLSQVPGLKGPEEPARSAPEASSPAPAAVSPQAVAGAAAYVAPRTPLEEEVALIWGELLGRERVGVHDNFFDLGGQSLAAVRLTARLREEFGIGLAVRDLYANFTVEEVAWRLLEALAAEQADEADAGTGPAAV
ncbi:condensation domain-containing protein [Streptomyces sp. NPDC056222]|uniref:condensation domain-containing protein n=1 Tax=Streptomyces sp. NPDC056222 TaxID=3345749 RepID=UPI0035DCE07B